MRKQFNQIKDFVHNKTISRNDRQDLLSKDILDSEKHVENIKQALSNAEKKISGSLLSGVSDSSSNVTLEKKIKKLPSYSLGVFFNDASESLGQTKNDSVLGKTLLQSSQLQKESAAILAKHEEEIENQCINKIQSYLNEDLPNISRTRKQLNRTYSDLSGLKVKYESTQKSMLSSSQLSQNQVEIKLESLRKDLEDSEHKLGQCRDAYETEMLDFLSKEVGIAQVFYDYVKLHEAYHEKMLEQIRHSIPVLEGVIANTNQKPVFGVSLEEHLRTSGRQISLVIETCINLLLPWLKEEGIFRISGSVTRVKLIRNAFNAGHLETLDLTRDMHAVASTLKSYLRELPQPLLTFDLYPEWIKAATERDPQERLKAIWTTCNALPESYKNNLRYLIKFLHELTKYSGTNKMSSQNLAIAIGPSLLWSNGDSADARLSMSNYSPIIIEALITYCDDYFFPEEVIFCSSKPKMIDSIDDNFDQDIHKQCNNQRIKKPAPKPPGPSISESLGNSSFLGNGSESPKLRDKMIGSLRLKSGGKQSPNSEHVKNHFESTFSDSPPPPAIGLATVRRNHISPRVDSGKSGRRPISICERPVVPPPEVPPRPSLPKSGHIEAISESESNVRRSMLDLTEIDSNSSNSNDFSKSQENLLDIDNFENCKATTNTTTAKLYPSLNELQKINSDDSLHSPFSFPCSEFIDENHDSYDNSFEYVNTNVAIPAPQKPPRSSLANHSALGEHDPATTAVTRKDLSPPPIPASRPSKSPSPTAPNSAVESHINLMSNERTYL